MVQIWNRLTNDTDNLFSQFLASEHVQAAHKHTKQLKTEVGNISLSMQKH